MRSGGRSGLDYLASLQASDGHYRYSRASDQTPVWVTAQAMMAANRRSLPLAAVPTQASGKPKGGGTGGTAAPKPGKTNTGGVKAPATAAAGKSATAGAAAAPEPAAPGVAVAPAAAADDDGGDGDGSSWPWLLAGVLVATAAVWGGWMAYRRRLPQ